MSGVQGIGVQNTATKPVQGLNKVQGSGVQGGGGGGGGGNDPFFANVTALLHMDGTNGSTTFTDQIGHTFTRSGTSQVISTAAPKFGTGAAQNTVNDTTNVSASAATDFDTTGAFTYEGWARNLGVGTNGVIISMVGTTNYGFFHVFTSGAVTFFDGSSHATGFNLTVDGLYHHFAISSAGAGLTVNVFIDGNVVYTGTATSGGASNTLIPIGGNGNLGIGGMLGYIDDVRFTKGVNRYTGPFTPPSAPFPNS